MKQHLRPAAEDQEVAVAYFKVPRIRSIYLDRLKKTMKPSGG
jgi:hypothetical protein